MPLKEKYAAIAIPASNTPGPELNECSTTGVSAPRSRAATPHDGPAARLTRAREHRIAVGVERRIAEMAVGVDQHVRRPLWSGPRTHPRAPRGAGGAGGAGAG